ncbi:MAG: IgGFc-binding protein, partial [Myxococcales bacterium]|nr:IgGFc-binding protein [Myxococcales bacterium]
QACDHLEVQMPPIQSWGRAYVSAPMADGSIVGTNVVRVMPAFESTEVTVTPPQGGVSGGTLSPGQFLEFDATTPFAVTGTSAVLVAQYLRGQYATTPESARGDPAMTVLVPSEQFRSEYTFILPSSYNASTNGQNHVLVIRPPGLEITVDGAPLSVTFTPIGGSEVAVVLLDGGTHTMTAAMPFGLIAYGMGSFTSYATPAGLDLKPITILI